MSNSSGGNNNGNSLNPPALQQQAQSPQYQQLQGLGQLVGGTGAALGQQYPPAGSFNGPWISSTDQLLIEIRDMLKRGKSRMG